MIEMVQFRDLIFWRAMNDNQRTQIQQSEDAKRTKHFIGMPRDDPTFPRSDIVRGDDYKGMAKAIYRKYIEIGSELEVNVDHPTKKELSGLIGSEQWQSNVHFDHLERL